MLSLSLLFSASLAAGQIPFARLLTNPQDAIDRANQAVGNTIPLPYAMLMLTSDQSMSLNSASFTPTLKQHLEPCSQDLHEYCSFCVYCWPDPLNASAPWPNVDGKKNPVRNQPGYAHDKQVWYSLVSNVNQLALRYHLMQWTSPEVVQKLSTKYSAEDYAKKAVEMLYTWFVNPSTRMNPSAEYAQSRPNAPLGMGAGIIEFSANFPELLDSLVYLRTSKYFSQGLDKGLTSWISDFLKWNVESKSGQNNAKRDNNIVSWFTGLRLAMILYLENVDSRDVKYGGMDLQTLKQQLVQTSSNLLSQIDANGAQPQELRRGMPFHYSIFNLQALARLGALTDAAQVSKKRYPISNKVTLGQSSFWKIGVPQFRAGMDYLMPSILSNVSQMQPVAGFKRTEAEIILRVTQYVYGGDGRYRDAFECAMGLPWNEWPNLQALTESPNGLTYTGPTKADWWQHQDRKCESQDLNKIASNLQNAWVLDQWQVIVDPDYEDGGHADGGGSGSVVLPNSPPVYNATETGGSGGMSQTTPITTPTSGSVKLFIGMLGFILLM